MRRRKSTGQSRKRKTLAAVSLLILLNATGCGYLKRQICPVNDAPIERVPQAEPLCQNVDAKYEQYRSPEGQVFLRRYYEENPVAAVNDVLYFKGCHRSLATKNATLQEKLEKIDR